MDSCSRPDLFGSFFCVINRTSCWLFDYRSDCQYTDRSIKHGIPSIDGLFSSCVWCSSRVSLASTGDFRTSLEYYPSCDYAASAKWVESDVSRRLWREFCTDSSGIGDVFQVQGSKNEGALHASCDFRNLRRNRTGYLWNHLTEEEAIYLLDDWWCHFRNLFDGIWNNQLHNGRIRDFWGGKLHHGNRRQWYVSSVYRHCYCFGNRVFADFFLLEG